MLRQIGSVLFCWGGIMLCAWGWLQFPFMKAWLAGQALSQAEFLQGLAAWVGIGAVSCLFLSKHIACWGMKVDILPFEGQDEAINQAWALFQKLGTSEGLVHLPQFGIYERPEVNAMAVGVSLRYGVVAVSRGAIEQLSSSELELLLRRQLSFLRSHDPVALSLMQGMIYSLSLYAARMLALLLGTSLRATEEEETSSQGVELLVTAALITILALPSALLFWAFSRQSALRADRKMASLSGAAYRSLLDRLRADSEPKLEMFSDSFKWRTRRYPSLLALAAPVPQLTKRTHVLTS